VLHFRTTAFVLPVLMAQCDALAQQAPAPTPPGTYTLTYSLRLGTASLVVSPSVIPVTGPIRFLVGDRIDIRIIQPQVGAATGRTTSCSGTIRYEIGRRSCGFLGLSSCPREHEDSVVTTQPQEYRPFRDFGPEIRMTWANRVEHVHVFSGTVADACIRGGGFTYVAPRSGLISFWPPNIAGVADNTFNRCTGPQTTPDEALRCRDWVGSQCNGRRNCRTLASRVVAQCGVAAFAITIQITRPQLELSNG